MFHLPPPTFTPPLSQQIYAEKRFKSDKTQKGIKNINGKKKRTKKKKVVPICPCCLDIAFSDLKQRFS
jgi:hypothetical protein